MHSNLYIYLFLGFILFYFMFIRKNIIDSFNVTYAPIQYSLGNSDTLAELNETIWTPNCFPHGEYYTMRYGQPKNFSYGNFGN
jgi:hypothetical protein